MIEKEFKTLITDAEFQKVKESYIWDSVFKQKNHYYADINERTIDNNIMFRVRERDNTYKVQVKFHKKSDNLAQVSIENEYPIDNAPDKIEDSKKYLGEDMGVLKKLGFSETVRYSKMWDNDTEICLDMTTYLGYTDYEIEVEYRTEEMNEELRNELFELGISFTKKPMGKFRRFLMRLKYGN